MKTIILLLTFVLAFSKGHSQCGWYDEEEEKIPDKFVKYDTTIVYLLSNNHALDAVYSYNGNAKELVDYPLVKGFKITKYTHHFPAITQNGNPVYWTCTRQIFDALFKPIDKKYNVLQIVNEITYNQ